MNRGAGPRRSSSLGGTSRPLSRSQGLAGPTASASGSARQKGLRRAGRKTKAKIPQATREAVRARSGGRCIVCRRKCRGQLHHVFDEALFPDLALLEANLVLVCVEDHDRHTRAFRRIPVGVLPLETLALAATDPRLLNHLARYYPEV